MASSTPQSPRPASSSRTLARGFSSAPFSRSQRAKPLEELTELSVPEPSCHPVWHTELRKSYFFSDFHGNRNLPRLMKPSNLFCCRPLQPVALSRSSGRTKAGPKSRNTTADQHRRWRAMVIYKWTNKENHPTPRCTQQLYVDNVYTGFLCSLPAVAESKIFLSVRLEVAQNAWLSLASSKFHIQSPLKKKLIGAFLVTWGMMSVSIHSYFFGGIRSTWDSIEKWVSVSLISAISQNTQPVETSSPPVCPGSDTQQTPSWCQISSKIWLLTQLVPWRCSPYRNDWWICLFGERHVGKVEAVRDGKLQNMWWKKTTIDIYIYIYTCLCT